MSSINEFLPFDGNWQMDPAERLALVALLEFLRPRCSLEIGSKYGGSLAVLSNYSEKVYSLDIDPTVPERLGHFRNVEFAIGDSQKTLPAVLQSLQKANLPLEFALIDGDHSERGVREDCQRFLEVRPLTTLYILMHDSFNPDVRKGILSAGWRASPWVHAMDVDAVPGSMHDRPLHREMWGGFALAVLKHEQRVGDLETFSSANVGFRTLRPLSMHSLVFRRLTQLFRLLRPRSGPTPVGG